MKHSNAMSAMAAVVLMSLALLAAACGGDDTASGRTAARNPTDPRRVPTATVPAQLPTPIPALEVEQTSRLPLPETYVVRAGDTLGSIARELGVTAEDLARANPSANPNSLRIGQELRIPRPTVTPASTNAIRGPASPTGTPGGTATPATPTMAGTATRTPTAPAALPTGTATRTPTSTAAAVGTPTVTPTGVTTGAGGTYTVEAGDTACAIARKLGVSLTALAQANGVSVEGLASLRIGQVLQVPRSTGEGPGC